MNSTPEALPMPPSLPPTVMTSPAVHPAEIAAEKDNFQTPEVAIVSDEQTTPEVIPAPVEQITHEIPPEPVIEQIPDVAPVPVEQNTHEIPPTPVIELVPEVAPVPVDNMSIFVREVSNNIDVFMKTNNEKLVTMNNVVEQLYYLGLSDNSAIDSLNNQRIKYIEVLDKIRRSFEEINSITNFII